jgi:hypothetical protein
MASDVQIIISAKDLASQTIKGVTNHLKDASRQMERYAASTRRASLVATGMLYGIKRISNQFLGAASDAEEMANVTNQVFRGMTKEIDEWARSLSKDMGRSIYQMKEFAGYFQAMLEPMVGAKDVAADLSKGLAELAVDMASFWNVADEEAFEALKSGLTGMTRPLRRFGIVLTQAQLQAFALSQGIKKSVMMMSEAERVQLRYQYILAMTANVQGDAKRNIDSYKNSQKALMGDIRNLAEDMGNRLLPAGFLVVRWAREAVQKFDALDDTTKQQVIRWSAMITAVLGGIVAFGLVVNAISVLVKGLTLLGAVISLVTSPWVIGAALIVGAVVAVKAAWDNNWLGIQTMTLEAWEKIKPVIDAIIEWGNTALSTIWNWSIEKGGAAWDWITGTAIPWLKEHLGPPLKTAWNWAINVAGEAWAWLRDTAWPWLKEEVIPTAWNWMITAVGDAYHWVKDTAIPWLDKQVKPHIETTWKWIVEGATEIADLWKRQDLTTLEKLQGTLTIIVDRVKVVAKNALEIAQEKLEKVVIPAIIDWEISAIDSIRGFREWLEPAKDWVRKWREEAWEGVDIRDAFQRGMQAKGVEPPGWVSGIVEIGINAGKILGEAIGAALDIGEIVITAFAGAIDRVALYLAEVGAYWAGRLWAAMGAQPTSIEGRIAKQIGQPGLDRFLKAIYLAEGGEKSSIAYGVTQFREQGYKFGDATNQAFFDGIVESLGLKPHTKEYYAASAATSIMWMWDSFKKVFKLAQDTTMAELTKEQERDWIEFLGGKYCPVDASPLNVHWIPNVTEFLKDIPPEQYGYPEWLQSGIDAAQQMIEGIRETFSGENLKRVLIDAPLEKVNEWLEAGKEIGGQIIEGIKQALIDTPIQKMNEWLEAGREIGRQLVEGIKETFSWKNVISWFMPTTMMPGRELGIGGYSSGIILPGYGGGDRIPALLEAGEAVVPAHVVAGGLGNIVKWFRSMGVTRLQAGGIMGATIPSGLDPVLASNLKSTQDWIGQLSQTVSGIGKVLVQAFTELFSWLGEFILSLVRDLIGEERYEQIADFVTTLKERMNELWDTINGGAKAVEDVDDVVEEATETVMTFLEKVRMFIYSITPDQVMSMAKSIQKGFSQALSEIENAWAEFAANIIDSITFTVNETGDMISIDWMQTLVNIANHGLNQLAQVLIEFVSGVKSIAEQFPHGSYGEVNYPDLAKMRKNYENWDKNVRELQKKQSAQTNIKTGTTVGGSIIGGIIGFIIGAGPLGALLGAGIGAAAGYAAGSSIAASYDAQIADLKEKLKDTFQKIAEMLGTAISDMADALGNAFSADTHDGFLLNFATNLEQATKQALIKAFMTGELMRPLLQSLSDFITVAVWDGVLDASEKLELKEKFQEIIGVAGPFYEALSEFDFVKELGLATDAVRDFTDALRNVPAGFKVALTRFDVATPLPVEMPVVTPDPIKIPIPTERLGWLERFFELLTGGFRGAVPKYHTGGVAATEGLAWLRRDEIVMTPEQAGSTGGVHHHYHLEGANIYGWNDFKRKVNQARNESRREAGLTAHGLTRARAGA